MKLILVFLKKTGSAIQIKILIAGAVIVVGVATYTGKERPEYSSTVPFDVEELKEADEGTYSVERGKLTIPPKSRVTVDLESYCLNPGILAPYKAPYTLIEDKPKAPMQQDILKFIAEHPEYDYKKAQDLLWKLAKVKNFSSFSFGEQFFLRSLDPKAEERFNVQKQDVARHGEEIRRFRQAKIDKIVPQPVGMDGLYVIVIAFSKSKIRVTIYNPTGKELELEFYRLVAVPYFDEPTQNLGTAGKIIR